MAKNFSNDYPYSQYLAKIHKLGRDVFETEFVESTDPKYKYEEKIIRQYSKEE